MRFVRCLVPCVSLKFYLAKHRGCQSISQKTSAPLPFEAFFDAVQQGDPLATEIMAETSRYMGYGIAALMPVFAPDTVIISDILVGGGGLLLEGIDEILSKELPYFSKKPEILLISSAEDLVLLGASAVAIDSILSSPTKYLIPADGLLEIE